MSSSHILRNQSFIHFKLFNKSSFYKKMLSFQLQPGMYKMIKLHDHFYLNYGNNIIRPDSTTVFNVNTDRMLVSIPELNVEHLVKINSESHIQIDWDKYDEIRRINLIDNNDDSYQGKVFPVIA